MSTLSDKEREELSLLLPWYANGTLDSEDSQKVEAALAQDEALAREFDLVLEDQAAVVELVSEEEVPVSMAERFKAALNAEQEEPAARTAPAQTGESMISRIVALLFPERQRAYAYVAAALVVLVPAVAIFSGAIGTQQTTQYQTASGEEEAASAGVRMLVTFNANAGWSDIDAFLKENRIQIVKGPNADGFYELEFEKDDALVDAINAQSDIFEFALPVN